MVGFEGLVGYRFPGWFTFMVLNLTDFVWGLICTVLFSFVGLDGILV